MGISMAVGSFGQFVMLPVSLGLIGWLNWHGALIALSALSLLILPLAFGMKEAAQPESPGARQTTAREALAEAFAARDFWLLAFGFFACGFQVVFIAVHLPALLADKGIDASVATTVLALIGLFNVAGTYYAGLWGGTRSKPMMLFWVYLCRAAVIAAFVIIPASAVSAYGFGVLMGLFWLSTVPLTNGTVATIWGVRHMSMLGGIVFFMHQVGGFVGGWFGGWPRPWPMISPGLLRSVSALSRRSSIIPSRKSPWPGDPWRVLREGGTCFEPVAARAGRRHDSCGIFGLSHAGNGLLPGGGQAVRMSRFDRRRI
jgi:predicted MFS family arabinose efflux permease